MNDGVIQKQAKRRRNQRGAVLMETVIAIPLYLIMLGGIFWIGDLTVTRQQLLIADRYVAWNRGLRYADKGAVDADTVHRLLFSDRFGIPSTEHVPTASQASIDVDYDWSQGTSGQVTMRVSMPDWVQSMANLGQLTYNLSESVPGFTVLRGRELANQRHVVLMRTEEEADPLYIRNKYGVAASGEVATRWKEIAGEKWPHE